MMIMNANLTEETVEIIVRVQVRVRIDRATYDEWAEGMELNPHDERTMARFAGETIADVIGEDREVDLIL